MEQPRKEEVDHPAHYNSHPSGVEAIDVIEDLPFNIGTAIKYLFRRGHKGSLLTDLRKAHWYVERELARRRQRTPRALMLAYVSVDHASRERIQLVLVAEADPQIRSIFQALFYAAEYRAEVGRLVDAVALLSEVITAATLLPATDEPDSVLRVPRSLSEAHSEALALTALLRKQASLFCKKCVAPPFASVSAEGTRRIECSQCGMHVEADERGRVFERWLTALSRQITTPVVERVAAAQLHKDPWTSPRATS